MYIDILSVCIYLYLCINRMCGHKCVLPLHMRYIYILMLVREDQYSISLIFTFDVIRLFLLHSGAVVSIAASQQEKSRV